VPKLIILFVVIWFTFYSYQMVIGDLANKQDWLNWIKKNKVAGPGHHWILLTLARSINHYGDIEIPRIRQIMIEHGK